MRVKDLFKKEEQIVREGEKKLESGVFGEKGAKTYSRLLKEYQRLCRKIMRLTSISDRMQADLNLLNKRLNLANDEINEKNDLLEQLSKRLSRDLEDTEEKYRSIFENAVEGMFQSTPEGCYHAANTAMALMLGYDSKEEMLESDDTAVQHYSDPEQREAFKREIETRGVVREFEMTMRRKNGVEFPVSVNARLVANDEDDSVMYEGSVVDISERKEKEKALLEREAALAASKAKSAFLANMSHEIRTPMNAVIGMADLLLGARLNPKQREYAEIIRNSASDLLGILNDILDFSKIEAGKLAFEDIPFDLRDAVESVADMFLERLAAKPIELVVDVGPDVPRHVVADPLRLRQVLTNLLSNAFKFTEAGDIRVEVSLITRRQDTAEIMFSVADTGLGVPEEAQRRLFQAFSQADTSTTRKFGGTGLGLAICKKICTMMDGDIWVESEPNKGSRFSFTARMAVGPNPETAPEPPLAGRNVLLATPSSRQVLVLMRAIGEFGARVQAAKTAAEARGMLKNLDDDPANWVVLADARLPDASGVEFIAQIAGTGAAPAAVLMGPYGDESLKNQAYQAGAKAYLFKPVKTSRLLNGLLQALGIETEAPAEEAPRPPSGHSLAGARLLLVEDNPVNQRVAKEILGQERIQTACAENGRQAVDLIAEQLYDAVLMDIQMPEMDGFEAARAIRDMNQMDQPPIIAMTAHAMQGDRERCLDAGMDDYVAKPINRDELLQTLRKYVAPRPDAPAPEPGESCVSDHAPRMNACGVDASVLDFDEGVERVGGNHAVFLNILADYLRFNNDFGRQLSNLVDQGRLQEAERLAHSLKGAAGNLAAGKLADRARRLEHALGQERIDEIPELLEPVLEAQQEIQAIYDRLQQDVEPPRPPHGTASGEKAGPDHDQALLSQLAESLAQIDPLASLRSLNALKASLAPNGDCADPELSSTLQELEQQVIEYEFDQAVQTLDRMESLLQ